jgi:hypothetical protein
VRIIGELAIAKHIPNAYRLSITAIAQTFWAFIGGLTENT